MLTELYLCRRQAGLYKKNSFDFFFYDTLPVSNYQLNKMWKRLLRTVNLSNLMPLVVRLNRAFPGYKKHEIKLDSFLADPVNLHTIYPTHLAFLPEEKNRGKDELQKLGIEEFQPFICFHARDSLYLNSQLPGRDWGYHNYRDSDIKTYLPAMEEMARRGYYGLRMGALVKEPLKSTHPRIIDYASSLRNDFLDIYLSSRCHFFLGCASGIDEVPKAFRRPVLYVNFIPLNLLHVLNTVKLFIPKRLWLRAEKRFLTFSEILNSDIGAFCHTQQYEQAGIEAVNNTAQEITDVVAEMEERLKSAWLDAPEDEELQQIFWSKFSKDSLRRGVASRIGRDFLRQNKDLLR
jgi:putative glycosyltransferase (TIGR04372 family)